MRIFESTFAGLVVSVEIADHHAYSNAGSPSIARACTQAASDYLDFEMHGITAETGEGINDADPFTDNDGVPF